MAAKNAFIELDKATAVEALEWLQTNAPSLAAAVEVAVRAGASPKEIKYRVMQRVGAHRMPLAVRCELAAEAVGE